MAYLLDTNIIIIFSRNSDLSRKISAHYNLFDGNHTLVISTVTLGEINAFIKKVGIGVIRKNKIKNILNRIAVINLSLKEVIDKYGDIDAYSRGVLKGRKGSFSARNMGKNDLWIAATASAFDLTLLTTDKDFDHLAGEFISLEYINLQEFTK